MIGKAPNHQIDGINKSNCISSPINFKGLLHHYLFFLYNIPLTFLQSDALADDLQVQTNNCIAVYGKNDFLWFLSLITFKHSIQTDFLSQTQGNVDNLTLS